MKYSTENKHKNNVKEEKRAKKFKDDFSNQDNELFLTLDRERYQLVSWRKKWILYSNVWVEMNRRYYYDKLDKKYVYLLDRHLGIEKYQHFLDDDKQTMFEMIAINKMTFNQVRKAFRNHISTATIQYLIKSQIPNIVTYSITNPQLFKFIYIDIDDTYLCLRINNKGVKYKFRVIHFYQYYDEINNKFINEIKMVIVTKCNVLEVDDKSLTLKQINAVIAKNYGDRCNFKVYVSSDGARDLKAIAERLNATHALDRFHVISWVEHTFKTEQLKQINWLLNNSANKHSYKINLKKQILELVFTGKIDEAISKLTNLKKKYPFSVHKINGLIKYLNNNKESIMTWQDSNYYGSFTETFCQQLVKSYFGNVGRCFSKITFIKMLQANCMVVF